MIALDIIITICGIAAIAFTVLAMTRGRRDTTDTTRPADDEVWGRYHRAAINKPPFDLRRYAATGELHRRPFDHERD